MKRITADCSLLRLYGRGKAVNGSFPMFTTGSGVEINAKASELWVEIEADYNTFEPWVSVLIDGERVMRVSLNKGLNRLMIFRNMNAAEVKNVRITKDVQCIPDDTAHKAVFKAFELEGEVAELTDKSCKIEFIGDSITTGEGLIGAKSLNDWITWCMDSVNNYMNLIAEEMKAEYRVISQSGWGVCSGWNNDERATLPSIYEKTCGACPALNNSEFEPLTENDFESWKPDFIVVNLGTNDCGAYDQPAFINPDNGHSYKNSRLEDGSRDPESVKRFENGVIDFLKILRKHNSNSKILWVYGVLGGELWSDITEAVSKYTQETSDNNVFTLLYPQMTDEQVGARFHPGVGAHKMMAELTVKKLKELIK